MLQAESVLDIRSTALTKTSLLGAQQSSCCKSCILSIQELEVQISIQGCDGLPKPGCLAHHLLTTIVYKILQSPAPRRLFRPDSCISLSAAAATAYCRLPGPPPPPPPPPGPPPPPPPPPPPCCPGPPCGGPPGLYRLGGSRFLRSIRDRTLTTFEWIAAETQ